MEWTTKLPTESGYYWYRKNKYKQENIFYVFYDHAKSIAKENANRPDPLSRYDSILAVKPENRVLFCRWCHEGLYDKHSLEDVSGEWYGPIKPPE